MSAPQGRMRCQGAIELTGEPRSQYTALLRWLTRHETPRWVIAAGQGAAARLHVAWYDLAAAACPISHGANAQVVTEKE